MRWYGGSIVEAVNLSKSKNAIFVVYIEGLDERSIEMTRLVESPAVSQRLEAEDSFVAIKLASGSEAYTQFAQIYQLVPVPSMFFIGGSGAPLEVVVGPPADVSTLLAKIDSVDKENKSKYSTTSLSAPSSSNTKSKVQIATADFLSGEQKQEDIKAAAPIPGTSVSSETSRPAEDSEEMETVCEGDVCFRRPVVKTTPVTTPDAIPSSSSSADPAAPVAGSSSSPEGSGSPESDETKYSLQDKIERAKKLSEMKRKEKIEEEKRLEKEKELERRAQGQGVAELKRWQHEQEMKNLKEERLREKKENERVRARILEQIAQDRADRQARFMQPPSEPTASVSAPQIPTTPTEIGNTTRIQFKLADGSTHTTQMSSESTLAELRQYVRDNIQRTGSFSLCTTYPRRMLDEELDSRSLRQLGLAPSAALLLLARGASAPVATTNSSGTIGMLIQMFWSIFVSPVQNAINWVLGRRPRPGPTARNASTSDSDSAVKRRRIAVPGGAGTSEVRREGNTYRLKDRDSDDENNTWNGNSTQQM